MYCRTNYGTMLLTVPYRLRHRSYDGTVFTRNVKRGHPDPDCVSAAEPDDLLKHISTGEEAILVAAGDQLA
jgi:hypothetical protein